MTKNNLLFLSNTFDEIEAELEELIKTEEWYCTAVIEKIQAARQIINEELKQCESYSQI